jgi:argininosuccinate lyase
MGKGGKLWGGRFQAQTHQLMEEFNASIAFDRRLYLQDIRASQAHARMLARQGVISPEDAKAIVEGLEKVRAEIEAGKLQFRTELEDIHTHIEDRLAELIGPAARRLHTARSRNDQIATDLRLWVVEACQTLDEDLQDYQRALLGLAETNREVIMPGYTHLQRAQPVLLAHHLLAYIEMAWRDRARLAGCRARAAVLPLGAAALAGTTYPLDPASVAKELGFSGTCANSLDAVSDRDFAAEFLFVLALVQVHLSRLAEELVIWCTQEFGFVRLPEEFATGSSIMPQKMNPDAAELVRAKTGRVVGHLVALLTMLKGQPLAYNKDLQEDKEPVFDAFDTVHHSLAVLAALLPGVRVDAARMRRAVEEGFLNATELADYLAAKGIPFRQAHEIAGRAVRLAEERGCRLEDLSLAELQEICPDIQDDVYAILSPEAAVARRTTPGGTAPERVNAALTEARKRLWPEE